MAITNRHYVKNIIPAFIVVISSLLIFICNFYMFYKVDGGLSELSNQESNWHVLISLAFNFILSAITPGLLLIALVVRRNESIYFLSIASLIILFFQLYGVIDKVILHPGTVALDFWVLLFPAIVCGFALLGIGLAVFIDSNIVQNKNIKEEE